LDPEDIESLNNMAFMLADDLKKPAEGLKYAEKAASILRSRPSLDAAKGNLANVYDTIGWVRYLANDLKGAAEDLNRSIQYEPLPDTYLHLAQVLKKQGDASGAKKQLDLCIKLATDRKDAAKAAAAREMLAGF